jgi:hypothetical protein
MVSIEIEGLEETMAMLRDAPKTVVAKGFLGALSAAGNVIADVLETNTAVKSEDVGGVLDRGELRESIVVRPEVDSGFRGGSVSVGFDPSRGADSVALWLDSGHRIVSHRGKVLGETSGTGFMRKSADQSLEAAADAFAESLLKTIRETFPDKAA